MEHINNTPSSVDIVTLYDPTNQKQLCTVELVTRIATKTFDAIHRSHVFEARWKDQRVILKAWEVGEGHAGVEMLEMYRNEKEAFNLMTDSGLVPKILFDGFCPKNGLQQEARVLVVEWRKGERIRSCWNRLSAFEKSKVHESLLRFFRMSLTKGIYHDDLRQLRNILWVAVSHTLTVLDFELVGVKWGGPFTEDAIESLATKEVGLILEAAENLGS